VLALPSLARAAEAEGSPAEDEASAADSKAEPAAEKERAHDREKAEASGEPSYGHGRQFGLRAALVFGYHMLLRYDKSPYCHAWMADKSPSDQPKFCGFGAPLAVDLGLSAGLIDFFEPFIWARFGFAGESATNTKALELVGAGARLYTMSDSAFKIYLEPAVGVEFEGQAENKDPRQADKLYRTDLLFHLAGGPHFDFTKNFGIYADAGLTLGILRSLHSTLELKAGIQGRL
jgi:hypothetical protein